MLRSCPILPFAPSAPALSVTSLRAHRAAIERQIEILIAILDVMDGDPEAEDDGTAEPLLGWTITMATGTVDDREDTSPEAH